MRNDGILNPPTGVFRRAVRAILLVTIIFPSASKGTAADNPEKVYKRAIELRKKGNLEEARLALQESLQLKPDFAKAKILLGLTCYQLGEQQKKERNAAGARAMFQEAVTADPDEAYWHAAFSQAMQGAGEAANAAKECSEAARLSPMDTLLAEGCLSAESVAESSRAFSRNSTEGYKPGTNTTPPVPYHKPEPPYSEEARSIEHQGVAVLIVIVNDMGTVERLGVLKPLGLRLDQQALRTVSGWRFRPATRAGKPFRIRVIIEVQFRLY